MASIVLIAATASPQTASLASSLKLDAMLTKPIGQEILMRALAEFLLDNTSKSSDGSGNQGEAVAAMIERLRSLAMELNEALGANDMETTQNVVGQLRNVGRRAGFENIATLAEKASEDLTETKDVEACIRVLLDLSTTCEQAQPGQQAA